MSTSSKAKPKQSGAGVRRNRGAINPVKQSPRRRVRNRSVPKALIKYAPQKSGSSGPGGPTSRTVTHSEMFASITSGTSGFQVLSPGNGWVLNPRNTSVFPWLAYQATGWEQFHFKKLKFRFVSGNPSTASGMAYSFIDYDVDDLPPTIVEQFSSAGGARTSNVWDGFSVEANSSLMHGDCFWKYVAGSQSKELRTVYGGFLNFAVNTSQALTWDIWVDYDVEFRSPQLVTPIKSASLTLSTPLADDGYDSWIFDIAGVLPTVVAGVATPALDPQVNKEFNGRKVIDLNAVRRGVMTLETLMTGLTNEPIESVLDLAAQFVFWYHSGTSYSSYNPHFTFSTTGNSQTWNTPTQSISGFTSADVGSLLALGVRYVATALYQSAAKTRENGATTKMTLGWRF